MIRKLVPAALASAVVASAATITIDPADTKQKILGFGAGSVYYQDWVTAMGNATQQAFYDTAFTGLNLSILRIGNWKQDSEKSLANDAAIIKAARQRLGNKLKIEMSSWSAPPSLKPSNSINGSAGNGDKKNNTLKTSSTDPYGAFAYADFAHWWKTSYQAYEAMGIAPDYISLQNEPDMNAEYEETLFEPSEKDGIAGYDKALQAVSDSLNSLANPPKIIGPEPLGIGFNNFQNYMAKLDDSKLGGYAYHLYHAGDGNDNSGQNYLNPENFRKPMSSIASRWGSDTKPLIMTEFCTMENDIREADMVGLAHIMQVGFTSGKLNAYIAWELYWGEKGQFIGVCAANWGNCTKDEIVIAPEYHAMRHYSKFVNPNARVITSTSDQDELKVVAFRSVGCDSISVIAINTANSPVSLNAPSINGYNAIYAVQSVESGAKSKEITTSVSYNLPARSITTLVYTMSAGANIGNCEDAPIEEGGNGGSNIPSSITIVDFSKETSAGKWSGEFEGTLVTTPLDGVSQYVKLPLAGCNQDDCGYQHGVYALSDMALVYDPLQVCSDLVITMRGVDSTNSVNIGGAGGSEWTSYQYGNDASGSEWSEVTIPLTNEKDESGAPFGSNSLTFNSNGSGIYIAKIEAVGCGTTSIHSNIKYAFNDNHMQAKLFDLNGNLLWTGTKNQALNDNGTLRLDVRQGTYILKTSSSSIRAVKK